jgi:hypothetical protein
MKRDEDKYRFGIYVVMFLFVMLFMASFVSAGFFDWFEKTVTGRASSSPTNLSITVSGVNPAVIEFVSPIADVDLASGTTTSVNFSVIMSDADGVSDLNDTSVTANFTRAGEATRFNDSCVWVGDLDAVSANYSCTIDIWYWDEDDVWDINVSGRDLGNLSEFYNDSESFNLNTLQSLVISPASLTWSSISPNATNQTSNNDPTVINNTGNWNGTVRVIAINLLGESDVNYKIPAENFTVGLTTGGGNPECGADLMQNGSSVILTNSVANRGNLSLGSGVGQEEIYYCLFQVPSNLSSQAYSTVTGGSWTILHA